jgi:hypothetical protein
MMSDAIEIKEKVRKEKNNFIDQLKKKQSFSTYEQ